MSSFVYYYHGWAAPASAVALKEQGRKWGAWFKRLAQAGHLKDRGYPLDRSGRLVRGPNQPVTDLLAGKIKDFVGGYSIIEADSLNHAVALSMDCPNFETGGFVEIRPLLRRASKPRSRNKKA